MLEKIALANRIAKLKERGRIVEDRLDEMEKAAGRRRIPGDGDGDGIPYEGRSKKPKPGFAAHAEVHGLNHAGGNNYAAKMTREQAYLGLHDSLTSKGWQRSDYGAHGYASGGKSDAYVHQQHGMLEVRRKYDAGEDRVKVSAIHTTRDKTGDHHFSPKQMMRN